MAIQFSQQETAELESYFDKMDADETQKQLYRLPQASPEWNRLFLLFRKLLAYGVHATVQTDGEISYQELQRKTQKPEGMLVHVHTYPYAFKNLLAAYTARQLHT